MRAPTLKKKKEIIKKIFGDRCSFCSKQLFKRSRDHVILPVNKKKDIIVDLINQSFDTLENLDPQKYIILCKDCHGLVLTLLTLGWSKKKIVSTCKNTGKTKIRKIKINARKELRKETKKATRHRKLEIIKKKFGNKCYICEREILKKKRDFCLHHVSYEAYQEQPGNPTAWSLDDLKKIKKDNFLLLCPTCHNLVHTMLNYQRWKRPCQQECILEKLKKLMDEGKLQWKF